MLNKITGFSADMILGCGYDHLVLYENHTYTWNTEELYKLNAEGLEDVYSILRREYRKAKNQYPFLYD